MQFMSPSADIRWFKFNVSLFHMSQCLVECFTSDATRFYWLLLHIKWKEAAAGEILKGADE